MLPKTTPWGPPQTADNLGDGVLFVTTAGHGGYYVPPTLNKRIPPAWRKVSFNGQAARGWYEEDCDWSMVALSIPEKFIPQERDIARRIFAQWIEPKLYRGAAEGF